jgi:hypothetical protein
MGTFETSVLRAVGGDSPTQDIYRRVAASNDLSDQALDRRVPIGKAGALHSPAKRRVRWALHNRELARMDGQPCIDVPIGRVSGADRFHVAGVELVEQVHGLLLACRFFGALDA